MNTSLMYAGNRIRYHQQLDRFAAQGAFVHSFASTPLEFDLNIPQHLTPLVSILIRSTDRAYLAQALDSVALQTYQNIEVIVLAVRQDHRALTTHCGKLPMQLVPTDQPVTRSEAANRAMEAATGQFLIFLDDDDWMMPGHIARLAEVLIRLPQTHAVYTGIGPVDADGKSMGQTFDLPSDPIRQMAGNITPIHSVLFLSGVLG